MSKHESWTSCPDCGTNTQATLSNQSGHCSRCLDFPVRLGRMDWNLFQRQRSVLIELASDERLTEQEQDYLTGLLHLTDHIIDTANYRGVMVPTLDEVILDRLAAL